MPKKGTAKVGFLVLIRYILGCQKVVVLKGFFLKSGCAI